MRYSCGVLIGRAKGLEHVISVINAEDKLLIVDDVFDSGNTILTIRETIKSLARCA
jgi:hypoxanthine phosphoribosyltransferase